MSKPYTRIIKGGRQIKISPAELRKQKARIIRYWEARKRRYDFVRRRKKKILSLSTEGWPRMTHNPDYIKWLDIVYDAKAKGIYSFTTANCDVIANMQRKAIELNRKK